MEDILQLLLYVAIALAGIAGPLIKNSRARKEQEAQKARRQQQVQGAGQDTEVEPVPSKPSTKSNPFEEFLRQQLEEFENLEEESIAKETEKDPTQEDTTEGGVVREGTAAFESTTESLLSDNMSEKGFSISESVSKMEKVNNDIYNFKYSEVREGEISDNEATDEFFDARKALIYSEIFKRPDF